MVIRGSINVRRRALLIGAGGLLTSCASAPPSAPTAPRIPFWPRPPDRPRFIYEHTLRTAADIGARQSQDELRQWLTGDQALNSPLFEKPADVAARGGRIYVTDTVARWVIAFDVPRRRVFRFGLRTPGRLKKPWGLALDGRGNVYVADTTARRIVVYDGWGLFIRSVGTDRELERPTGVAVNAAGTRIYAIDRGSNESDQHRVVVYDGDGAHLRTIGSRGSAAGAFNVPVAGAVAPDGTVYVLDAGNFRIQALTAEGEFLRAFGQVGAAFGGMARPRGLAVDGSGRIYVSDAAFGNVQIFDHEGRLLLALGSVGRRDEPGRYGLASGVAVDETGRVYIADQLYGKVEILRPLADDEATRLQRESSAG